MMGMDGRDQHEIPCEQRLELAAQRIRTLLERYDTQHLLPDTQTLEDGLARLESIAAQEATRREEAEQRAQICEAQYQRLIETADAGIWTLDADDRTNYINQCGAILLGYTPDEMQGRPVTDFLFPEDTAVLMQELATRHHGEARVRDYRMRRKDGSPIWVHSASTPILDERGKYYGAFAVFTDITARKQAEEALEEVNRRLLIFENLVHNAPNAIVLMDRDYRFTYANNAYARLHEVPAETIVGKALVDIIGQEHYQTAEGQLDRVFDGETLDFTTWYSYPSGSRYMHVYYYPIRLNFNVAFAGVILTDITLQAKIEDALRYSEERFHAFSEASTEGIVIHEQGKILEVNQAIVDHLGYPPEEMVGRSVLEFTAPESREEMVRHVMAGDPGPYTAISLHKDGSRTIGEIRARNFTYKGRPVRLVAMRDVTELKQAQDALEQLLGDTEAWAAEMDATITSIADGLIIYDNAGEVKRTNRAVATMAGFPRNALALPHRELVKLLRFETPDGQPIPYEQLPHMRALHGERVVGEIMVIHPTPDQSIWLSSSAAPIRTPRGELLGAVLTFTNITQIHQLQEEREVYIHTISHDLRTPLSVINGHAKLIWDYLEEVPLDGQLRPGVEAIRRSVQRMNTMIQDLVDAARTEGGQLQLQLHPINLTAYITDFIKRSQAVINVQRFQVDIPPNLPAVIADYDRLERIFTNLLSNALKYSPPECPVIIRARQIDSMVEVSVQDFGHGIATEDIPHLFQRFYRVKGERHVEGIGLGLYITRMLVEAHGGHIWVESEVEKGSMFCFTLPVA
ncbi:MAG: PAS domain-containing sensor histidine kinase [Armatimonadota bacterium]